MVDILDVEPDPEPDIPRPPASVQYSQNYSSAAQVHDNRSASLQLQDHRSNYHHARGSPGQRVVDPTSDNVIGSAHDGAFNDVYHVVTDDSAKQSQNETKGHAKKPSILVTEAPQPGYTTPTPHLQPPSAHMAIGARTGGGEKHVNTSGGAKTSDGTYLRVKDFAAAAPTKAWNAVATTVGSVQPKAVIKGRSGHRSDTKANTQNAEKGQGESGNARNSGLRSGSGSGSLSSSNGRKKVKKNVDGESKRTVVEPTFTQSFKVGNPHRLHPLKLAAHLRCCLCSS